MQHSDANTAAYLTSSRHKKVFPQPVEEVAAVTLTFQNTQEKVPVQTQVHKNITDCEGTMIMTLLSMK